MSESSQAILGLSIIIGIIGIFIWNEIAKIRKTIEHLEMKTDD